VTRIRQAERAKTDFVATVSHELRTPITPIKGYVEILQARGPNLSEDKRQDMLRIVAERADHLARLVEDLLLASRISSEPGGTAVVGMQRECTDLAEAARRAAADWLRGPDSRLELELPPGPLEVDADPLRLVQVLANLISNAHKYSPTDQEVRLRVWRDNGWAMAAVADRGRGIPREELDRVFEKFHRVEDPMTMTTGGTGLGLYIARELTRAMGGRSRPPAPPAGARPSPSACRCAGAPTAATTPGRPAVSGPTTASRPAPGPGGPPTRCAAAPSAVVVPRRGAQSSRGQSRRGARGHRRRLCGDGRDPRAAAGRRGPGALRQHQGGPHRRGRVRGQPRVLRGRFRRRQRRRVRGRRPRRRREWRWQHDHLDRAGVDHHDQHHAGHGGRSLSGPGYSRPRRRRPVVATCWRASSWAARTLAPRSDSR
jgi:Histidine kinase-, DNA gyrase B-, and HSP90-like ATPase/His Kinase A (phospho-acceptor) domain